MTTTDALVRAARRVRLPQRRFAVRPGTFLATSWLVALLALVLASSFGSWLDPLQADFRAPAAAPSAQHWFGTDATGRDVFARTVAGARSSFAVAAITVGIGLGAGLALGLIAGYLRGWVDRIVGIGIDLLMAFPALLLVMLVVTLRGPSVWTVGVIIGTLVIPSVARVTRAVTLTIRERDFVTVASLMGASRLRIVLREILPNVAPVVRAYAFTVMTVSIIAEGSLSFLGFGLQPPTPSWGGIIADGRTQLAAAPWISLTPAVVLCLTVLALNLLGENLTRSP